MGNSGWCIVDVEWRRVDDDIINPKIKIFKKSHII
jgi:uncharacterized UPF0146 family protein